MYCCSEWLLNKYKNHISHPEYSNSGRHTAKRKEGEDCTFRRRKRHLADPSYIAGLIKTGTFKVWKLSETQPHAVTVQSRWSVISKLQNVQFRYRHGSPPANSPRGHLTTSHFLITRPGRQTLPAPSVGVSPVPQDTTSSPRGYPVEEELPSREPWQCPQHRPPSCLGGQKGSLREPPTQQLEEKRHFRLIICKCVILGCLGCCQQKTWGISWRRRQRCYLRHIQTVNGSGQTGELSAVHSIHHEVSKISFTCFFPPPFRKGPELQPRS